MLLVNNAESQVSGTAVTTANSGGTNANAFDERVVGTNMTETFDNAHPAHGTNAFKIALTSTATAITYVGWTVASFGAAFSRLFGAIYIYTPTAVTSSVRLVQFLNGATVQMGIGMTNGLQGFQFRDSGDVAQTPLTGTILASTLYRLEYDITFSTAAGAGTLNVYVGDSATVQGTSAVTAKAFGANAAANGMRAGINTAAFSATSGAAFWLDSLNVNDTGFPGAGPYTSGGAAATAQPWRNIHVVNQAVQRAATRCQKLTRRRSGLFVPAEWSERIMVPA